MKRNVVAIARLVVLGLLTLVSLPACGGGGGGTPGSNSGLLWNSQSGVGVTTPGDPVSWVDPNSGLGGGTIGALTPSVDDITYSMPTVYIPNNTHPLMTSTNSQTIRQAEDLLVQAINGYRSKQMGGGLGGLGGFGGNNGGLNGTPTNAFLMGHDGLTRNARANSKHFAYFHPGPVSETNPEGDSVNGGGVAPAGRLAKAKITAAAVAQMSVAGQGYADYNAAASYFISNFGNVLTDTQWTHIGGGYWTGGSEQYYWTLILAKTPTP
jgi:hypothetical protein